MTDTTRLGLPYPVDADLADVPTWMRNLATELDAIVPTDAQGPISSRPAAGLRGALYTSTNEGAAPITYRDDGATWRRIGQIPRVTVLPSNPADGDVVLWAYADNTGNAIHWSMRFNAAINMWECMGGNPSMYGVLYEQHVVGGAGAMGGTGISFSALPKAGIWRLAWGSFVRNVGLLSPGTAQTLYLGPIINGLNAGSAIHAMAEWVVGPSASAYVLTMPTIASDSVLNLNQGDVIGLGAMATWAGGNVALLNRWMSYMPVRVAK